MILISNMAGLGSRIDTNSPPLPQHLQALRTSLGNYGAFFPAPLCYLPQRLLGSHQGTRSASQRDHITSQNHVVLRTPEPQRNLESILDLRPRTNSDRSLWNSDGRIVRETKLIIMLWIICEKIRNKSFFTKYKSWTIIYVSTKIRLKPNLLGRSQQSKLNLGNRNGDTPKL